MPASPQQLWDWHAQPGCLARLMPPWERVRILSWVDKDGRAADGMLADGVRVTLQPSLGPFRPRWISLLQDVQPGSQFVDIQLRGAFAYWRHRHCFLPHPGGDARYSSLLVDEIDYRLPLGGLGQLIAGAYVRRRLERMFDYRHRLTLEAMQQMHGV